MTAAGASAEIGVSLGRCDDMRAEVFLRLAGPGRVVGTITGPRRGRDTTLPTTARLAAVDEAISRSGVVARAILTEPAYWTPELPNLYRLEATVEVAGQPIERVDRLIGLRRLGVRGRSLWLDGRRWVPRAVAATGGLDVAGLRAASLATFVADAADTDLARADETGLAVFPLCGESRGAVDRIAGLARHPAAMLAIMAAAVPAETVADVAAATRIARGTMLIGHAIDGSQPPPAPGPHGDVFVVTLDAGRMPHEAWRAGVSLPLVAWRRDTVDVATGRAACDALQRDLAAWGLDGGSDRLPWDWAGYLVG